MLKIKIAAISFHSLTELSDRRIINLEVYSPKSQDLVFFSFIGSVWEISLD